MILQSRAQEHARDDGQQHQRHRFAFSVEVQIPSGGDGHDREHDRSAEGRDVAPDFEQPLWPARLAPLRRTSQAVDHPLVEALRAALLYQFGELEEAPGRADDDRDGDQLAEFGPLPPATLGGVEPVLKRHRFHGGGRLFEKSNGYFPILPSLDRDEAFFQRRVAEPQRALALWLTLERTTAARLID
jgi:hypothetical protein